MSLKDSLTPKDTEEIKPSLFIQKKGEKYRVINPLVWNNKFRIKEQLKTIFSIRVLLGIAFTLFLVWTYLHDVGALREFYFKVKVNPIQWCHKVLSTIPTGDLCTQQWQEFGLCETEETLKSIYGANLTNWRVK